MGVVIPARLSIYFEFIYERRRVDSVVAQVI
jgi:hypothetical protein